ncbi:hypothetical protein MHYP_G00128830 [Metynnis hypsauchen]
MEAHKVWNIDRCSFLRTLTKKTNTEKKQRKKQWAMNRTVFSFITDLTLKGEISNSISIMISHGLRNTDKPLLIKHHILLHPYMPVTTAMHSRIHMSTTSRNAAGFSRLKLYGNG